MEDWTRFYYVNPTPERLPDEVRAFAARPEVNKPEARVMIATFLGRVMNANPSRIAVWFDAPSGSEGRGS